ncbi:maleylpyruvate isomerase family mycothiol-dependent enzyme [Nocardia higoensis]|uniref:maleylpyruvate isomerase family mycothiol-dependent enzyme n=1 Tax=Nocardia higoensis TaxID=228599 RepID=UPI0002E62D61|nr:maleylpyruvate isomerase family mycothiol-dependent enzyme [Nocardia higoensis]
MDIDQAEGSRARTLPINAFCIAADHAVSLTAAVPEGKWDDPALGSWTVRSLVGHIGRAMSTVVEYLTRPATDHDVRSAVDYYRLAADRVDPDAVRVRGEQAGAELGDQPIDSFRDIRDRAVRALSQVDDRLISTAVGGMLLSDYLPTRTFELAVHGLDLARAIGLPESLPGEVVSEVLPLAAELAVRRGHGETVLLALTGRGDLPDGFSIL